MPRIQVVTLVKSNPGGLRRTMHSVLAQSGSDHYLNIVPASASDVPQDVSDPRVRVLYGAPRGIYEAMNWTLSRLHPSDYVQFLNAGDFFLRSDSIEKFQEQLLSNSWTTAGFVVVNRRGFIRSVPGFKDVLSVDLCHQATVTKVQDILDAGGFDEEFSYVADSLLIRKLRHINEPAVINEVLVAYESGGFSSQKPGAYERELRHLNRILWRAGEKPETLMQSLTGSVVRLTRGYVQRALPWIGSMRTVGSRRRDIQAKMVRMPHWTHVQDSLDSLRCCHEALDGPML